MIDISMMSIELSSRRFFISHLSRSLFMQHFVHHFVRRLRFTSLEFLQEFDKLTSQINSLIKIRICDLSRMQKVEDIEHRREKLNFRESSRQEHWIDFFDVEKVVNLNKRLSSFNLAFLHRFSQNTHFSQLLILAKSISFVNFDSSAILENEHWDTSQLQDWDEYETLRANIFSSSWCFETL